MCILVHDSINVYTICGVHTVTTYCLSVCSYSHIRAAPKSLRASPGARDSVVFGAVGTRGRSRPRSFAATWFKSPLDDERGPAHPRAGEVRFHGDRHSSPPFMPPRATARHPNVLREGVPSPGPPSFQGVHTGGADSSQRSKRAPKCVQTRERVRRQGRAEGRAKRDHGRKGHRAQCSPILCRRQTTPVPTDRM